MNKALKKRTKEAAKKHVAKGATLSVTAEGLSDRLKEEINLEWLLEAIQNPSAVFRTLSFFEAIQAFAATELIGRLVDTPAAISVSDLNKLMIQSAKMYYEISTALSPKDKTQPTVLENVMHLVEDEKLPQKSKDKILKGYLEAVRIQQKEHIKKLDEKVTIVDGDADER